MKIFKKSTRNGQTVAEIIGSSAFITYESYRKHFEEYEESDIIELKQIFKKEDERSTEIKQSTRRVIKGV